MDKFYYIVSQLPTLFYDKESFMTIDRFMEEAGKWLAHRDYRILSMVDMNDTSQDMEGPRLWRDYRAFEKRFREDLAAWRKSLRSGQEYKPVHFPSSLVNEGNPLEVEKKLLEYRWNTIEAWEREHDFDLEFLILYLLKLQILRRLASFNKDKGMEVFQEVVNIHLDDLEAEREKVESPEDVH